MLTRRRSGLSTLVHACPLLVVLVSWLTPRERFRNQNVPIASHVPGTVLFMCFLTHSSQSFEARVVMLTSLMKKLDLRMCSLFKGNGRSPERLRLNRFLGGILRVTLRQPLLAGGTELWGVEGSVWRGRSNNQFEIFKHLGNI